jgi:prevent-host-death family protein
VREATIREAKAGLAGLVRVVQAGQPVRLTRRGNPVAVLLSDREFQSLGEAAARRTNFMQFLRGWRREMIAKGIPFPTRKELGGSRDRRAARTSRLFK